MEEVEKNQSAKASKGLVVVTVAGSGVAFVALYALLWGKWCLVTLMKMKIWSLCF